MSIAGSFFTLSAADLQSARRLPVMIEKKTSL
jgi:hypothetical protein